MAVAIVVEDGTGLATANSYIDAAWADQYFSDRGNTTWAGTADAKASYLIRATDYIEMRWGSRFTGSKLLDTQALSFPRADPVPAVIPEVLKKAVAEYAVRAMTQQLAPDPVIDPSGQAIRSKKDIIGPIDNSIEYSVNAGGAAIKLFRPYPVADALLKTLMRPRGLMRS